jgi:hypothetical protein
MKPSVRVSLLLFAALAFLGDRDPASAWARTQDDRDMGVDQALGELDAGSWLLAPDTSGKAGEATTARPGHTISPGDAGAIKGGRGAGASPLGVPRDTVAPGLGGGAVTTPRADDQPIVDVDIGGTTDTQVEIDTGGTEPGTSSGSGIDVDVDVDTSTGEVSGGVSVDEEPVIETDVDTGADLGGTVVTDTTTIDASTETTEGDLTIDVSAGSDTLGDTLTGTGGELDPDSDSSAEDISADNDDCNILDPLSIPEYCL